VYSFRLIYLTFINDSNAPQQTFKNAHDSPIAMSLPLFILAFGSIFVGYLFKDMIIGAGTPFFLNSIYVNNVNLIEAEFLDPVIKLAPVIFSIIAACSAMAMYHFCSLQLVTFKTSDLGMKLYTFLNNK